MNTKNLIPIKRLAIKRRQRSIHRWMIIDGSYVAILATVAFVYAGTSLHPANKANPESIHRDTVKATARLTALQQSASLLKATLQSESQVSQSPDWSVLLRLLSGSLGDEVVLSRMDCLPDAATTDSRKLTTTNAPEVLRISGFGRSQESVTLFVLTIEQIHFFDRVRLVQSSQQSLNGSEAITFELICKLPTVRRQP